MRPTPAQVTRNWSIRFYCQWPAVVRPGAYNWIDFTFLKIHYEYEKMMGNSHEVTVMVLGCGFTWTANFKPSARANQMLAEIDQIRAGLRDGKSPEEMGLKKLWEDQP